MFLLLLLVVYASIGSAVVQDTKTLSIDEFMVEPVVPIGHPAVGSL